MLMLPGIFWEYSVFHVVLDGAKGSHNHRNCCCFEPPHSLNLDFQVFVFVKLFCGFDWRVGVEGYSHVKEKEGFIPFQLFLKNIFKTFLKSYLIIL